MIRFEAAADGRSTEVLIGDLVDAAESIQALIGNSRALLVSDERLLERHGERLSPLLAFDPVLVPGWTITQFAPAWFLLEHLHALPAREKGAAHSKIAAAIQAGMATAA